MWWLNSFFSFTKCHQKDENKSAWKKWHFKGSLVPHLSFQRAKPLFFIIFLVMFSDFNATLFTGTILLIKRFLFFCNNIFARSNKIVKIFLLAFLVVSFSISAMFPGFLPKKTCFCFYRRISFPMQMLKHISFYLVFKSIKRLPGGNCPGWELSGYRKFSNKTKR